MAAELLQGPSTPEVLAEPDDVRLLRAYVERGDREALGAVFSRHMDAAYRLAVQCSRNASDAEDAVQTAFLNVHRRAAQFRAESSVRAWIMGFVIHACKDRAKAERSREGHEGRAAKLAAVKPTKDEAESELPRAALSAVQTLPRLYRLPVWLHYLEGLSFKEAGRVLDLPENTVRSQANRGLEQVRQALAAGGFAAAATGLPAILASAALPTAPAKVAASVHTVLSGGCAKALGGTAAAATKGAAASKGSAAGWLKMAMVPLLLLAGTAAAVFYSGQGDENQTSGKPSAAERPSVPRDTREEAKGPVETPAAWPAGKVVGWRGDGTGRYPDAQPPSTWSRNEKGEKKNIAWETKLPCYSWATPIIVGDKIITRSEPYDLICLDKMSGKLLWIRSHPPFLGVSADEKKVNPAFQEIEPLIVELQKVNDAFVAKGWTQELYAQKYALQKKIDDLTAKADKKYKLSDDKYVESWAGYTGQTPCSDGQCIYFTSGSGITACYDLQGSMKWLRYEQLPTTEHGHGWSPALFGDKFVVPTYAKSKFEVMALNKATGETVWRQLFEKGHENFSMARLHLGGEDYGAIFCHLFRVSDGKFVQFPNLCENGVVQDDRLYSVHMTGHITWFKIGADFKITMLNTTNKEGYLQLSIPPEDEAKKWDPMSNFWMSAPLYHEGLLYALSQWGRLAVIDPAKNEIVYIKKLPFDFKNPQHRKSYGMGAGASPALGGKYIYMIDSAGCTIVIEPGREYKEVAKNNIDEIVPHAWEPKHWMDAHHEQTEATLVFDGNWIYIRGEQYLYCIAETKNADAKPPAAK
ncbi:MAG: sigma-70 family RNA polymerase sigma factor [Planctomycetes bacterium]|nr:sigma-70 family RNA polymerase sigma factor [Planctomycetota bacterium]